MSDLPNEPFKYLDLFRKEFDRFFSNPPFQFDGPFFGGPRIDIRETENAVHAICDMPGIDRDDIEMNIEHNVLHIRGTMKRSSAQTDDENFYHQERFSGQFQRSVLLPAPVLKSGTKATYRNGILEVIMPKAPNAGKQTIDIDFD